MTGGKLFVVLVAVVIITLVGARDGWAAMPSDYWHSWSFDNAYTNGAKCIDCNESVNLTITNALTGQTGKVGQAYYYDGAGDWVSNASWSPTALTSYTVGFWLYHSDLSQSSGLERELVFGNSGGRFFTWTQESDNRLQYYQQSSNCNTWNLVQSSPLTQDQWYYVTLRWNGATMELWMDGTNITSTGKTSICTGTSIEKFYVGADNAGGTPFNGYIDELVMYRRALSASEIADLYNGGSGVSCAGGADPCAYSGSGDWVIDGANACVITSSEDLGGNNIICDGAGTATFTASPTNWGALFARNACGVTFN